MSTDSNVGPPPALQGLWVPLIVPLASSGEIDGAGLDRLVDHVLDGGVDGLWVNGTSGAFHALTDAERLLAVSRVVERARGRAPVVAHVGDTATPRVIAHARAALEAGADYIASLPPYYLAYAQAELVRHYTRVAEAIGRPLVLYNFPMFCKVSLAVSTVVALAGEGVALGIKESASTFDPFRRLMAAVRDVAPTFRCLHGAGSLASTTLQLGGDGIVCGGANVVPRGYARLVAHARAGDWDAAHAEQQRINGFLDALQTAVGERPPGTMPMIGAMKWLLCKQGVIGSDAVREPLMPLTADERERLEQGAGPFLEEAVFS